MKAGWEIKKLRDVCLLINGRAYNKPELLPEGKYPVLRVGNLFTNNHWYYSDMELDEDKYCENGDLLYAWSASFSPFIWDGEKAIFHYHIWKVQPNSEVIDKKFLYMWFFWDVEQIKQDHGTGTTMIHVSKGSMEEREISLPPLPEQKRLVTLLDEAFESIATAKANAQQNLKNARALFESHLNEVFTKRGEGWEEKTLVEVCAEIFAGGDVPKDAFSKNETAEFKVPVYANGEKNKGLFGYTNKPRTSEPSITISARGTIGYSEIRMQPFYPVVRLIVIVPKKEILDLSFVQFVISNIDFVHSGSSIPQLTVPMVKEYKIPFPSLSEQKNIVQKLDNLREETQRLEVLYSRKIAALDELKKALLHRAFSGEL